MKRVYSTKRKWRQEDTNRQSRKDLNMTHQKTISTEHVCQALTSYLLTMRLIDFDESVNKILEVKEGKVSVEIINHSPGDSSLAASRRG